MGGSAEIGAAATGVDAAELKRLGAGLAAVTAPSGPLPWDSAAARLGHRLYGEAQSNQAQGVHGQGRSAERALTQIGRAPGRRVDLTF